MIKRIISASIALIMLVSSLVASAENSNSAAAPGITIQSTEEASVKNFLDGYFKQKYTMLASLTYDEHFESFISPQSLQVDQMLHEDDYLQVMIAYRKAQINDLRFEKYTFELEITQIRVTGSKANIIVNESYELYFACAPTVKTAAVLVHLLELEKTKDGWAVVKDEYQDPEGIRKAYLKIFMENTVTPEQARDILIRQSDTYNNNRYDKLEAIIRCEPALKDVLIMYSGKTVACFDGIAQKIDSAIQVAPQKENNTYLVPVRFIAERLGATATWDAATASVLLESGTHKARIYIGEHSYLLDEVVTPCIPSKIYKGRTLVDLELISKVFDRKVEYDEAGLIMIGRKESAPFVTDAAKSELNDYYSVSFSKSDFPRIDGSTATYPLSIELGRELLGLDETSAKGFITHNTTHNAYVNLINGSADIIFVTPPSEDELNLAGEKGVELEIIPICHEGFVFLVNQQNPVENLTQKQVRDIYQGYIRNWNEVGGENAPIIPYQRPQNSGSQTLMESVVMNGLLMAVPPKEQVMMGMGDLIDAVADYSNAKDALGYSVYYYATTMYSKRNVKLLAIDGVKPDKGSIGNGTFPFTVAYYAVLRKDLPKDNNAWKLLSWILGQEGQKIVDKAGFVPVLDEK